MAKLSCSKSRLVRNYILIYGQSLGISSFFAGHSSTVARQGVLYLNQEDKLTIEQLKHGFAQAISNGLQLAIFNSCDGLGIAEELGKLFLPQSIVMRMPIPDLMAQDFIKPFFAGLCGRQLFIPGYQNGTATVAGKGKAMSLC